jgi:hypothetical protein
MQLKRILVSLLVAMMIISTGVIFASAEDAAVPTIAVETTSTADAEGNVPAKAGDTVEVNVVIKNNPGIALIQFAVKYDADALTLVDGKVDTKDGIFNFDNALLGKNGVNASTKGTITFLSDLSNTADVKTNGKVATFKFKVGDKVDGNVNVTVDAVLAYNAKYETVALTPAALKLSVHSFGKPVVTAPTCTTEGYTTTTCANCKLEVKSDVVAALGHKEEVIPAVAATCSKTGLTEGKKCSVCGEITVAQTEVAKDANAHGEKEIIPAVQATCETAGKTEGEKCVDCGAITKAQEDTEKAAHTPVVVPGTAATCTTAGKTDGEKCSVCGEVTKAQTDIAAAGHKEEVIPAENGMTEGKKCSVCGEVLVAPTEVPAEPANLTWLWIVIAAVVVIGAGAAVYFFVIKKKSK